MSEIENKLNSGTKVSLVFIAIGFIAGGALAIYQEPVPELAYGWSVGYDQVAASGHNSMHIIIEDVNNDGAPDLFFWSNPIDFDQYNEEGDHWVINENTGIQDKTLQLNILSGRDGSLIKKKNIPGIKWLSWLTEDCMLVTKDNDVIVSATIANESNPYNWKLEEWGNRQILDRFQWHLLRIDTDTLDIVATANITGNGWENESYLQDQMTTNDYFPDVKYITNPWRFDAPMNGSYDDDLLVITSGNFRSSTFGDYNTTMFFIDPVTLEMVSNITFPNRGPLGDSINLPTTQYLGWCDGPTRASQHYWNFPYLIYLIDLDLPPDTYETRLWLTSIDRIASGENTTWIIENQSVWKQNHSDGHATGPFSNDNVRCSLSFNSDGNATGITLMRDLKEADTFLVNATTPVTGEYFPRYAGGADYGEGSLRYNQVDAFQLTCINFHNVTNTSTRTFYCEGTTEWYKNFSNETSLNGINRTYEFGACLGMVPIKTTNGTTSKNTSMALIFSDQEVNFEVIKGAQYPFTDYSIFFLPANYSGSTTNSTETSIDDLIPVNISMTTMDNPVYNHISIDFDVDGDKRTDIPFMGTSYNLAEIEARASPTELVSGPMAVVTQNGSIDQRAFLKIEHYSHYARFLDDLNGDGVSDMFWMHGSAALFNNEETQPLDFITKRMADPLISVVFPAGIVLVALGVLLLLITLISMRKVSTKITVKRRARPIFLGLMAITIFAAVYMQINQMVDYLIEGQEQQFGMSDVAIAMANMRQTSQITLVIFLVFMPLTAGLYMIIAPRFSSTVVSWNRWFMGRKGKGKKKAKEHHEILFIPPFGRSTTMGQVRDRILTMVTMSITIGLTVFDYGTRFFDVLSINQISIIKGISDDNLMIYVTGVFLYMIIPSIIAMPFMYWLIAPSWLLDDAGVVYYHKKHKSTVPEDVETVSSWFSSKIIGFFGIGAIFSYAMFIIDSPIIPSMDYIPDTIRVSLSVFIFGFIIVTSFCIATLVTVMHDSLAPYNTAKLYKMLAKKKFNVRRRHITIEEFEALTPDVTEAGLLGREIPDDEKPSGTYTEWSAGGPPSAPPPDRPPPGDTTF
ncbi:MAG: hypothetical protein ACFFCS_14070 [Candidatus Hodarchaeota archaeon]